MKRIVISFCLLVLTTSLFAQVSSYPKVRKPQNFIDLINIVTAPTVGTTGQDTVITKSEVRTIVNDTIPVGTALHFSTITDTVALKSELRRQRMQFVVDTTAAAPVAGDSLFTQLSFINKHIEVYRGTGGGNMGKQYRNTTGALQKYHNGYRFNKSTGTIIFKPVFATNEHVAIEISDSTMWKDIPIWSSAYQTVYTAMTTKPSADVANAQNNMVKSLVAGGYWARISQFLVFANPYNAAGEANINWKNPGTYNGDNQGAAWVALEGYSGTGNTLAGWYSTNFIPSADSSNYKTNSATVGIYLRTATADAGYTFSSYTSGKSTALTVRNVSNQIVSQINTGNGANKANPADGSGLFLLTRTANARWDVYRNGAAFVYDTQQAGGLSTGEFKIFSRNAGEYSSVQASIWFLMNGVNSTEAAAINTIIETYMDVIGKGVE
jgi:hypothetical protein